jgi:hypothetical protein
LPCHLAWLEHNRVVQLDDRFLVAGEPGARLRRAGLRLGRDTDEAHDFAGSSVMLDGRALSFVGRLGQGGFGEVWLGAWEIA